MRGGQAWGIRALHEMGEGGRLEASEHWGIRALHEMGEGGRLGASEHCMRWGRGEGLGHQSNA